MFKILVVEDNKILNMHINEMVDWASMGMEIAGNAFNGEQGLTMALDIEPDLVIADVDMPKLNGLVMCKQIKENLPRVRFIFISSFDSFQYVKDAMDIGAYKYLLKPVLPNVLKVAVRELYHIQSERMLTEQTIETLRKQILKDLPVLRTQFFREAIHGNFGHAELASHMKYLQISSDNKYVIMFTEVDNIKHTPGAVDTAAAENWYILRTSIQQEFILLPFGGLHYVLESAIGSMMLLFSFENGSDINDNNLVEWVGELMEAINQKFCKTLTVILSKICTLYEMRSAYIKVQNAADSRFYSGGNHLVVAKETAESLEIDMHIINTDVKTLINNLSNETIEAFLAKYYATENLFHSEHLRLQSVAILTITQIMLMEKNLTFEKIIGSNTTALEKLIKIAKILDLRRWMRNIFYAIQEAQDKGEENGRNDKIVTEIKKRIENNYANLYVLGDVTDNLQISASHANFIFKSRTGMTIFDYLVRTKMEAAKEMLKDPFIRVYEVASKVGYENSSYFISVFKSHTGMTPKQFTNKE